MFLAKTQLQESSPFKLCKKKSQLSAKGLYINDVITLGGGSVPKDDTKMTDDRLGGEVSYGTRNGLILLESMVKKAKKASVSGRVFI